MDAKREQTSGSRRQNAMLCTAVGMRLVGCGILVAALAIPPPGEIDNSVLVAFGEISTFAATLFGVHFRKVNNEKQTDNEKDR